ncbi:DNA-directed RNA polymerase subunit omega [Caproiciproducens sp.]|uniref:DNA-directed RNA polymerase subunit omega n=1 Tax=Caproiciproducens sp. TaxID=1954376 RepID=UPI0028A1380E|nr:DNA-directed RNA polymerase subunit omega [Caproiciproducens sp.]
MLKPSADLIVRPNQSRYSLVVAVSKRAREIAADAENRGEILIEKPVDMAVHELMEHKYVIVEPDSNSKE